MADSQPTLFDSEIWKPVVGYEGAYEVSSQGRVRSLDRAGASGRRIKGKIRRLTKGTLGYMYINLSVDGKVKTRLVHRMVAEAFIYPCPEGMQVDHIDNDKTNNRVTNLQYLTPRENTERQKLFGTSVSDRVLNKTHSETVKTHCPRGHLLAEPNFRAADWKKGRRNCLACDRARAWVQSYPHMKPRFQEVSDSYYEKIMALSPTARPA